MIRKYLPVALGIIFSVGAVYFLVRNDVEVLQDEIADGRYGYVVPSIILFALALVTRGFRWRALVGYRMTTKDAFHIMNVGYMLNNLPLRVGEFARAWMTTRLNPPIAFFTSLSSIVVERVLDMLTVIVILGFSLALLDVPQEISISGAILGVITLIATVILLYFANNREAAHSFLTFFMKRLKFLSRFNIVDWLDHLLDGLEPLTDRKVLRDAMFWNIVSWALSVINGYVLMLVFFDEGDLPAIMLTIVMLAMAIAVPAVPGNLGTFEAAAVAGLWVAGVIASPDAPENAPAIAFALLLHLITIVGYFAMGLLGLWQQQTSLGQVRQGVQTVSNQEEATA